MHKYEFSRFGIEHLKLTETETPNPGPGEIRLDVKALSLNYRDLAVLSGSYNPKLKLPAAPVSDGAGVVSAVGEGVTAVQIGEAVMSHFIAGWIEGPYRGEYLRTTLGTPGAGLAAEQAVLPAAAVLPIPSGYDFAQAATLPIAALTAWSALVTEGKLQPAEWVLTLGTGGVSIFTLQFAKVMGAKVIVTSSSEEKLARARQLGADHTIPYRQAPDWDKEVLALTDQQGVDLVVETAGIATLERSLKAVRPGGLVALLGSVSGLEGKVNIARIIMRRARIAGVLVGSRADFAHMTQFIEEHAIQPVVDARFPFERLPEALGHMKDGKHFGKIVIDL
ncbi:MAG: NAD(P)-dependent alcohol dehydrogenase [Acidobacteriota bacterium]